MNKCKNCGHAFDARTTLEIMVGLLKKDPHRDIYETVSGDFQYTYRDASMPELSLTKAQVDAAVREGVLTPKYPGCYVLGPNA